MTSSPTAFFILLTQYVGEILFDSDAKSLTEEENGQDLRESAYLAWESLREVYDIQQYWMPESSSYWFELLFPSYMDRSMGSRESRKEFELRLLLSNTRLPFPDLPIPEEIFFSVDHYRGYLERFHRELIPALKKKNIKSLSQVAVKKSVFEGRLPRLYSLYSNPCNFKDERAESGGIVIPFTKGMKNQQYLLLLLAVRTRKRSYKANRDRVNIEVDEFREFLRDSGIDWKKEIGGTPTPSEWAGDLCKNVRTKTGLTLKQLTVEPVGETARIVFRLS